MMMHYLAVVYGTLCMPLLTLCSVFNTVGTLFILTHRAIQVVNCHCMLTLLWNVGGMLK